MAQTLRAQPVPSLDPAEVVAQHIFPITCETRPVTRGDCQAASAYWLRLAETWETRPWSGIGGVHPMERALSIAVRFESLATSPGPTGFSRPVVSLPGI